MTPLATATLTHGLERAGVIIDAASVAGLLALPLKRAARRLALALALLMTPLLLALALWHNSKVATLRHHPLRGVVAVVVLVLLVAVLARLIDRHRRLLVGLAIVALPLRVPLGSVSNGLLVALYVVIAAGAVVALVRDPGYDREADLLDRLLALTVLLYAVQAAYSPASGAHSGLLKAVENVGFFYVPFALLFYQLRRVDWTAELLRQALVLVVALGLLFALVGLIEWADGSRLLLNRGLDQDARFIRINSLFYDPNIYGRFLALTIVLLASTLVALRRRRVLAAALAALALLWLGLLPSLSESSIVAVIAGLVVAWLLSSPNPAREAGLLLGLAVVALALAFAFAASSIPTALGGSGHSIGETTSGRSSLVSGGFDLFEARPLGGYGSGSFSYEYLASIPHVPNGFEHHEDLPYAPPVTSDSHATPVTIAAEQGIAGLAVYLALLAACLSRLFSGAFGAERVARVAIAAAFTALLVHTLFYADFLEDPTSWVLLAVGAAIAPAAA